MSKPAVVGATEKGAEPIRSPLIVNVDPARTAKVLFLTLVAIEVCIVFLDYQVNYARFTDIGAVRRLFNSTREDSLASFISVTQTVLVACTLWLVFVLSRAADSTRRVQWSWLTFAILFSYMAIDDGAMIHERVATAIDIVLDRSATSSTTIAGGAVGWFPSYTWHVVFLPIFGLIGLYMAFFLMKELDSRGQRLLVCAGFAAFALAIVLDFIEGLDEDSSLNVYAHISDTFAITGWTMARFGKSGFDTLVHFSKSIEETIEMFGMTAFWTAFIVHIFRCAPKVTVYFRAAESQGTFSNRAGTEKVFHRDRDPMTGGSNGQPDGTRPVSTGRSE